MWRWEWDGVGVGLCVGGGRERVRLRAGWGWGGVEGNFATTSNSTSIPTSTPTSTEKRDQHQTEPSRTESSSTELSGAEPKRTVPTKRNVSKPNPGGEKRTSGAIYSGVPHTDCAPNVESVTLSFASPKSPSCADEGFPDFFGED